MNNQFVQMFGKFHIQLSANFTVLKQTPSARFFKTFYILVLLPLLQNVEATKNMFHYGDVVMGTVASQSTSLTIVYTTVYSGADQRKHQNSASLAFVRGIHRGPVNSPHKWPVTRKMFPFDDVIMFILNLTGVSATVLVLPKRLQNCRAIWSW